MNQFRKNLISIICLCLVFTLFLDSSIIQADNDQIKISQTDVIDYDVISNNANSSTVTSDKAYLYYPDRETEEGIIKESIQNPKDRKKLVTDDKIFEVMAADGWIYYNNASENGRLYRIRTDGTSKELLSEKRTYNLYEYKGELYYNQLLNEDSEDWYIQKMDLNTKEVTTLKEVSVRQLQVSDGWVYFTDMEGLLFRMRTTGEEYEKISIDLDYPYINLFIIVSEKLYLSTNKGDLFEVDIQSGATQHIHDASANGGPHREDKLSNPDSVTSFVIDHYDIYYNVLSTKENGEDFAEIWKVNLESGEKEKLFTGLYKGYLYLVNSMVYRLNDELTHYEKIIPANTPDSAPLVYADFEADQYWSENMFWAIEEGLISGYKDVKNNKTGHLENLLKPYNHLTEAQFLAILFRYLKPEELESTVPIDSNYWASLSYQLAQNYNLPTMGTLTDRTAHNKPITRGKVAQILASIHFNRVVTEREAVEFMYSAHLSNGYPDINGNLPKTYESYRAGNLLVRAHIVTFIRNYDLFLQ